MQFVCTSDTSDEKSELLLRIRNYGYPVIGYGVSDDNQLIQPPFSYNQV